MGLAAFNKARKIQAQKRAEATEEALCKAVKPDESDEQFQNTDDEKGTGETDETANPSAKAEANLSGSDNKPKGKRRGGSA